MIDVPSGAQQAQESPNASAGHPLRATGDGWRRGCGQRQGGESLHAPRSSWAARGMVSAKVALAVLFMCAATQALAACYSSASAVRSAHPGSWPSWTERSSGHHGERCWFPSTKGGRSWTHEEAHAHGASSARGTIATDAVGTSTATSPFIDEPVPLPRPRKSEPQIRLEESFDQIRKATRSVFDTRWPASWAW